MITIDQHKKDIHRLTALRNRANEREKNFIKQMMFWYKSDERSGDGFTILSKKQSAFIKQLVQKLEHIQMVMTRK